MNEDGQEVLVAMWDQYALAVNGQHGNAHGVVVQLLGMFICLLVALLSQ